MSCILNIETSTSVCSVAISEDGMVPFVEEDLKGPSHAVSLGVLSMRHCHLSTVMLSRWMRLRSVAGRDLTPDSGSGFRWRRESVTDATFR